MTISYREDLDREMQQGCDNPRCEHCDDDSLFLYCPRDNGRLGVVYHATSGTLSIACQDCQGQLLTVAVASRPRSSNGVV